MDERMHTCPWFHATNIPNAPPVNLVQLGIGGWQAPRPGVKVGTSRGSTVLTVEDIVMLEAAEAFPMNLGFLGKGNCSTHEPLREQIFAGAIGLKLHED